MPRRVRLPVAHAAAAAAVLGLAACGGSAAGASHDTPDGAVRGFADALGRSDVGAAAQWVAPAERSQFRAELAPLNSSGLRASIQLKDFEVVSTAPDRSDPNKAVVRVKGNVLVCLSGSVSGQALNLNTCEAQPITARGDASDEVSTVKLSGQWYVSLLGAGGGSSTSSSTSFSVTQSSGSQSTSSETNSSETTSSETDSGSTSSESSAASST